MRLLSRRFTPWTLVLSVVTCLIIQGFSAEAGIAAGDAGSRPAAPAARAALAAASAGLQLAVNERGKISRSVAAVASETTSGGPLTFSKPAGATVRKSYLAITTTGFTNTPLTGGISLGGTDVPLDNQVTSGISSYNYFTDVTTLVSTKPNAAAAGTVTLNAAEANPALVDGEVLIVVWNDPAVTVDQTVSVLYGALSPSGDRYGIQLAGPISVADPNTRLEMSLGISYSCENSATCGSAGQQYSVVDVDGTRVTSAAGGEDDGQARNGALITVGGEGDSISNPANANATPTGSRSDDELYDLRPFVKNGDTSIEVTTNNPSLDDNVFLAVFGMNPPVTGITTTPQGNQPPNFTQVPTGTVYPGNDRTFPIMASDPDGDLVTLTWSLLPLQPTRVTCDAAPAAVVALTTCRLTPTSGIDTINTITFTATDSRGASTTVTVKVGPAYYVGMGDSYSSGEGNPPFDSGTSATFKPLPYASLLQLIARRDFTALNDLLTFFDPVPGSCHRSPDSWERHLDVNTPYALQAHIACSQANAVAMNNPFKEKTSQIDQIKALNPKPSVIVLSVGGNDSAFGPMVGACYLAGHSQICPTAINYSQYQITHSMKTKLTTLFGQIHIAAPKAKIVVVGYPNIAGNGVTSPARCPWITLSNLNRLRETATLLDSTIAATVKAAPADNNLSYVSTLNAVRGHELCTGDSWVRAIHLELPYAQNGQYAYSAHPNPRGQQAMADVVSAYIRANQN